MSVRMKCRLGADISQYNINGKLDYKRNCAWNKQVDLHLISYPIYSYVRLQGRRSMFRIGGAKVRKIAIFSARSARIITILDFARVARRKF